MFLADTGVDDHFASRRSRLKREAAKNDKQEEGDKKKRSRSKPRGKGLVPRPPGFVQPSPLPEKDANRTLRTTEKAQGSKPQKKDKEAAGNQNKVIKGLMFQLEARLRIIERATSNTTRMKSRHPLSLKETGEMYNSAAKNNQGTMGPQHFHYLLGLMDFLAGEKTEKEKKDEQKDKAETKFAASLREARAAQVETADNMEGWEPDFRKHKKKTEVTSRISFAVAGSVRAKNAPKHSGEKFHSHLRVVKKAGPDKTARIEYQFDVCFSSGDRRSDFTGPRAQRQQGKAAT